LERASPDPAPLDRRHVGKCGAEIRERRSASPGEREPDEIAQATAEHARDGGRQQPDHDDDGVDG